MEVNSRKRFTEFYEYGIYLAWLIGIFIGIHIQRIYYYSPPTVNEVPSHLLIASHTHLLLMTIILFVFNREFRNTLDVRAWPTLWTEGVLSMALIGSLMTSIEYYFTDAAMNGGQLQLYQYVDLLRYGDLSWGSTLYALGVMGYVVSAIIARAMED